MSDIRQVVHGDVVGPPGVDHGIAGLPAGATVEEARPRYGRELAPVILGPLPAEDGGAIIYWMLNGIRYAGDDRPRSELRYELTTFTGSAVGPESPRTLGHRHSPTSGDEMGRPEICQVIDGQGTFVFHDLLDIGMAGTARATTFVTVPVGPGDTVVIPPRVDHFVMSSGAAPLVFADLIARDASIDADPVRRAGGPPWFGLRDGRFAPNPRYATHPPVTTMSPAMWNGVGPEDRRLPSSVSLYDHHVSEPAAYRWLTDPAAFMRLFPALWERTGSRITRESGGSYG